MARIVLTGGGTAGHVIPNLALYPYLTSRGYEVLYIGSKHGMERGLVEREGLGYFPVAAGKLRRYFDVKNAYDIARVAKGFMEALQLVRRLKPDLLFSKGGFVSTPVVWAASLAGIPVVIHESDMTPGLANRLSIPFAAKICCAFPETLDVLKKKNTVHTGMPIRDELFKGDGDTGRNICGFYEKKPVLLVIGGSQGSRFLNSTVRGCLTEILKFFNVCHICGKGGKAPELLNKSGYSQFEYVKRQMPHFYDMADIVLSRAGATTLFELLALNKANILVPLPLSASRGDQILNAESFERQGFSFVAREESVSSKKLADTILSVYRDREKYIEKMKTICPEKSCELVVNAIENVLRSRKNL